MKKNPSIRRTLMLSALSIVLCATMLVGTTFAWFTDSASSGINVIQSGNLALGVYYRVGDTLQPIDLAQTLFDDANGNPIVWEPGCAAYETFVIKNEGNLALKYVFRINCSDATANADGGTLSDVLTVRTLTGRDNITDANRGDRDGENQGLGASATQDGSPLGDFAYEEYLLPGEYREIQVTLAWTPGTHDNAYQNLRMHFGIHVVATQYTYEYDGLNHTYDQASRYPLGAILVTAETVADPSWYDADAAVLEIDDAADFLAFMQTAYTWNVPDRVNVPNFAGQTVRLNADVYFPDGYVWTPISPYDSQYLSNGGFCGTFDGQNHAVRNLTVTAANATGRGFRLGLFGEAGDGAVFKNLILDSVNTYGIVSSAGALCAQVSGNAVFENITVRNALIRQGRYAGGIVGNVADGTITFRNCKVENCAILNIQNNFCGALYGAKFSSATVVTENCTFANVVRHFCVNGSGEQDWPAFDNATLSDALTRYAATQAPAGGN